MSGCLYKGGLDHIAYTVYTRTRYFTEQVLKRDRLQGYGNDEALCYSISDLAYPSRKMEELRSPKTSYRHLCRHRCCPPQPERQVTIETRSGQVRRHHTQTRRADDRFGEKEIRPNIAPPPSAPARAEHSPAATAVSSRIKDNSQGSLLL